MERLYLDKTINFNRGGLLCFVFSVRRQPKIQAAQSRGFVGNRRKPLIFRT
jgi:hypothetical protein